MHLTRKQARDLIAFYLDAGVDAVIGEAPVDRMADDLPLGAGQAIVSPFVGANTAPQRQEREPLSPRFAPSSSFPPKGGRSTAAPARSPMPASTEVAVMAAREAARTAATLDELRQLLESFEGCSLRATATQVVFADGNPQARIMFVGEAPGFEEDISGKPFVGRSGKLLDRMMAAIGLDRSNAYIANVIPWRPPGNRTPTPQETAICLPFIKRQIELANPDILVCLGGPAAQTLLGIKDGITRARGRWLPYDTGSREIRALATFHPAFLLRRPLEKRIAWRDLLAIKRALAS